MDDYDIRILRELQQNNRQSLKELAAKVGLSSTPVHERVKKLERSGIISRNVALLDASLVGLELMAICNVSLTQHSKEFLNRFESEVLRFEQVTECFHTAGTFDYILKIMVSDMEEYQHFIVNELAAFEYIGKVQSSFVMTAVKSTTALPI